MLALTKLHKRSFLKIHIYLLREHVKCRQHSTYRKSKSVFDNLIYNMLTYPLIQSWDDRQLTVRIEMWSSRRTTYQSIFPRFLEWKVQILILFLSIRTICSFPVHNIVVAGTDRSFCCFEPPMDVRKAPTSHELNISYPSSPSYLSYKTLLRFWLIASLSPFTSAL